MKKYDVLLIDADGTIMDFAAAEDKAIYLACENIGLSITTEQAAQYKEINESLWRAFERREVTQEALKTLRFARFFEWLGVEKSAEEAAKQFIAALSLQADEIEGANAFMKSAAQRVPIVVVTNGIPSVQHSRFALSTLHPYVLGYTISGELGFAKPDPRMIEHALALAGNIPPERALMVGDEPRSDIAAAINAGVDSCWYNPSGRANATPHTPTYEITALDEVLSWL